MTQSNAKPESPGNLRILIVDDVPFICKVIGLMISHLPGFEVAGTAGDGLECLKLAEHLNPDIITLDINMPKMDGIEALEKLRLRSDVPVIIVSALPADESDLRSRFQELGNTFVVSKNFQESAVSISAFEADLIDALKQASELIATREQVNVSRL